MTKCKMETTIFSGIKFGDRFLTRNGKVAIYWSEICYPNEYYCRTFILPNGNYMETDLYDGVHLVDGIKHPDDNDIISKYSTTDTDFSNAETLTDYLKIFSNDVKKLHDIVNKMNNYENN